MHARLLLPLFCRFIAIPLPPGKKKPLRREAVAGLGPGLLQQREHALGLLVGLCEHGGGSLLNNLRLRQLRGGSGIGGVHDCAARGLDVA